MVLLKKGKSSPLISENKIGKIFENIEISFMNSIWFYLNEKTVLYKNDVINLIEDMIKLKPE